jgi:acylphosphatase
MLRCGLGRSPSDYLDAVVTAARDCNCRSLYRTLRNGSRRRSRALLMGEVKMHSVRHVMIRGRVQGVGYRAWTERQALARGLEGWIRNRRDGGVEAVFAGPAETLVEMLEACRRGPADARVDAVEEVVSTADAFALRRPGELFSVLATT